MEIHPYATLTVVANLPEDLQFVSDSQDSDVVREYIGDSAKGYNSFFVRVTDGEYSEVWGMVGIIPKLSKLVRRLR